MILARTRYETPFAVRSCDGCDFRIGPGEISGVLHIQRFEDQVRGFGRDCGLLRLTFGFGAADGASHTYLCVFHPRALFPKMSKLRDPLGEFTPHVSIAAVLDTCGMPPLAYEDGRQLWLGHRHNSYCDLTFQLRETEAGLCVRMRAYVITENPDFHDYVTVDYPLPLADLLWRRAARMLPDDVLTEAEDCVFIKATATPLVAGVTPSPIEVLPA